MFTGIVEETGKLLSFEKQEKAYRLIIEAKVALEGVALGDSIAVNGCCLTVVDFDSNSLSFDLLEESVRLTSIGSLKAGNLLNLERSLRFNGKIGGHFVSGHIDALGKILKAEYKDQDLYLEIEAPQEFLKYLVYKGSIAIDGISLTVAEVKKSSFAVWLIPHTVEMTNLSERKTGDPINLEFDLLAKYIERLSPGSRSFR